MRLCGAQYGMQVICSLYIVAHFQAKYLRMTKGLMPAYINLLSRARFLILNAPPPLIPQTNSATLPTYIRSFPFLISPFQNILLPIFNTNVFSNLKILRTKCYGVTSLNLMRAASLCKGIGVKKHGLGCRRNC